MLTADASIHADFSVKTAFGLPAVGRGDRNPAAETQNQRFHLSFHASLKLDFQGSQLT